MRKNETTGLLYRSETVSDILAESETVSDILAEFETAYTLAEPSKTPLPNRFAPPFEGPSYQIPFVTEPVAHRTIFDHQADNPVFLRPADVEKLYGIPASTVYDWIHDQAQTGFPVIKLVVKDESKRRMVLIPKRLLDEWIIEHSTLMKNKPVRKGKHGLPQD